MICSRALDLRNKFLDSKKVKTDIVNLFGIDQIGSLLYNHKIRLVIPINNLYGESVGYAFRALEPDDKLPKYMNTVYSKSEHLYGLDRAYPHILKHNLAIVVEGYMDVILCHQEGLENVVAMCGSTVSYQQAILLRRFTSNVVVVYDADQIDLSKKPVYPFFDRYINMRMMNMDPDEFILENGAASLVDYISKYVNIDQVKSFESKLVSLKE